MRGCGKQYQTPRSLLLSHQPEFWLFQCYLLGLGSAFLDREETDKLHMEFLTEDHYLKGKHLAGVAANFLVQDTLLQRLIENPQHMQLTKDAGTSEMF